MLSAIGAGLLLERHSLPPLLVVTGVVWALPWAQTNIVENISRGTWRHSEPNVLSYLLVAGTCVFLVWWGIHKASKALVNYGVFTFALTVLWFYFSSIMNKLDRSFGL